MFSRFFYDFFYLLVYVEIKYELNGYILVKLLVISKLNNLFIDFKYFFM